LRFLAIGLAALVFPAAASAGSLVLHPSGFGTQSYSAWKAHQGQPDSNGNADQALYFQKNVPTPVNAAGVAVVRGLEGDAPSTLTGLSWEHRTDGHCGAGAPRWDLFLRDSAGQNHTVFLGCAAAAHTPGSQAGWIRDSYSQSAISTEIATQAPGATGLTISGLAIVYDEGNDFGFPCPDVGNSCVYLDNIIVNNHCWTGASDNGANAPTAAECTPASFSGSLASPVSTIPTDSGLLTALVGMFPTVPATSWTFYPNVL